MSDIKCFHPLSRACNASKAHETSSTRGTVFGRCCHLTDLFFHIGRQDQNHAENVTWICETIAWLSHECYSGWGLFPNVDVIPLFSSHRKDSNWELGSIAAHFDGTNNEKIRCRCIWKCRAVKCTAESIAFISASPRKVFRVNNSWCTIWFNQNVVVEIHEDATIKGRSAKKRNQKLH